MIVKKIEASETFPAQGGYLGADNQMVRVTVIEFDPQSGTGTLLWGWNNASFLYRGTPSGLQALSLTPVPVDAEHAPQQNQAVEILLTQADLAPSSVDLAETDDLIDVRIEPESAQLLHVFRCNSLHLHPNQSVSVRMKSHVMHRADIFWSHPLYLEGNQIVGREIVQSRGLHPVDIRLRTQRLFCWLRT